MSLLAPFIVYICKTIITVDPELWEMTQWVLNGPFALNKKFLKNIIAIFFIYLLLPLTVQSWGCAIFGAKMTNLPKNKTFSEKLLINFVRFIHANLNSKIQRQISVLTGELITSPCVLKISRRFGWQFKPSSGTFEMVDFTMN